MLLFRLDILSVHENAQEVETEYVMRVLMCQEITGIPPGAGIHAL